ncbi:MAG TPA: hypothetical protein VGM86_25605 [Thermoanaerobaculia bacterium]|jgi:hypothetical protein
MKQESWRTILTGGALVVALTLAGPAPAHAASGPGSLWGWLAGLWGARIAAPWTGAGQAQGEHRHPGTATGWEKAGSCVDPNGSCGGYGTVDPVSGSGNDHGAGHNPHG